MEFGVLGTLEVRHGEWRVPTGSARERFVLAALLLDADRLVSTERLVDALWRTPPASAKAQLHNLISKIRSRFRGVDDELIVTQPSGYQLRLGGHRLDLLEFREYVAAARQAAVRADHLGTVAQLQRGFALWRGAAVADVPDEIAADVRQTLHEERLAAAELKLDAQLELGEHAAVLADLAELLAEHPYREHLYRRQMVALAASGRRADALAAYRQAYRRLVDDLGVEPGAPLRDLEQQILRGQLTAPVAGAATAPRQLPPVNGPVTGRDAMLTEVARCLDSGAGGAPPVVVLVGPGGVGKTTVGLAAGHRLADRYPGGQLYADLRGSHERPEDPYRVAGRFLRALGVPGGGVPDDPEERIALYRSQLAGSGVLLVLDDAAGEQQLRPLLPGSPRCGVLVTSRRQLGALIGAARITVPQLVRDDAVTLLSRISGAARVAAEPVAAARIVEICGALPLAVSIAAARLASHPELRLDRYADRLAAERGRLDELVIGDLDVRASIALSYHGLSQPAARLFRLLGAVPSPDWPDWVPYLLAGDPAVLEQLVDVHLVESLGLDGAGQRRYRLHDLVAAYAAEIAADPRYADELAAGRERLLDSWLTLVTYADELIGSSSATGTTPPAGALPEAVLDRLRAAPLDWFEAERTSLIDAVDLARTLADASPGADAARRYARLAGRIAIRGNAFLAMRSYDDDRDAVLSRAAACVREHGDDALLAHLLCTSFEAAGQRDRRAAMPQIAQEALAAARRAGDRQLELRASSQAARAARMQGDTGQSIRLLEEALGAARAPGTPLPLRAATLEALANSYAEASRREESLPLYRETEELLRGSPQRRRLAQLLSGYAQTLVELDLVDEAESRAAEALEITEQLGDEVGTAYVLLTLVDVDLAYRRWSQARERIDRAQADLERLGNQSGIAAALYARADLAILENRPGDAVPVLRRGIGIWREIGLPVEVVRGLHRLWYAYRELGDETEASACRARLDALITEYALPHGALRPPSYLRKAPTPPS